MTDPTNERGTPVLPPPGGDPFGNPGRHARVARPIALAVVLLGAVLLTLRLARPGTPPEDEGGHAQMVAPPAATAQPVMLDANAARRIGVTYAAVELGTLATEVRTVAQVTIDESRVTSISPKVEGWVEELFASYTGQEVVAGRPLLTIYSPMLVTAQEEFLLAGRLQGAVAQAEGDARRGASELRAAARRRLQYWDISAAQIDRLEASGEVTRTMTVLSPVTGVILQKNVLAGQRVMAGEALYQVADLGLVWLEGQVFERDMASVRLGQRVSAEFDALPGEVRTGRITYVHPTLDSDTRTARVRVELTNPGLRLKPGMYGTMRIAGTAGKAGLTIPRSAVLATGERRLVFVLRADGMLEPREVVTGVSTDERTEILRGLAKGDTVVRSATFLVDAESNLGSALGGMGGMPGMDMTAPVPAPRDAKGAPSPAKPAATSRPDRGMGGMVHSPREE